ncbi:J domain-containing protein [Salinibaculum rarum]|uniref:J domain-containing protein n=1 Tax=Salinibaculum rarum TaxID=3058903 RepID=UPI00265D8005|nr:J domain-containing protein [Salinibaculum sp. KK48]
MTAILGLAGLVYSPALLILALVFGVVTYLLYYQASGRMLDRIYRGVERKAATGSADRNRGGFGAGPREEWTPPRQEQRQRARRQQSRRERVRQARQRRRAGGGQRRQRTNAVQQQSGPTIPEAAQILDVDPGADESTVKRAYRDRIKDVHPDASDGDEEEFKRVQAAYERLTD